jgi:hypothetical protein
MKKILNTIIESIVNEELSPSPKMDGMKIKKHHQKMWAEDLELPPHENVSDVKMPFPVVDFPDHTIAGECTVFLNHGVLKDERDVSEHVLGIKLNNPHLYATQYDLHLDMEQLKNHLETNKKLPIVVGFPNGVLLIQDGHHRLAIQKLIGQDEAKVTLYVLNDWTDLEPDTEEWIKELGPKMSEMNAIGGGGVSATSAGGAWGSNKDAHELMWKEEAIGKRVEHGPTYFQMGSSLPDNLYNQKNGKPSRDPGMMGLAESLALYENLLSEAKIDDVKKRYPNFSNCISLFKDVKPKYLDWVGKQISLGGGLTNEKLEEIFATDEIAKDAVLTYVENKIQLLKKFDEFSELGLIQNKDIGRYKNWDDLKNLISSHESKYNERQKQKIEKKSAIKIYEDNNYLLVQPTSKEASQYYGKNSKWCISATESHNYYDDYSSRGIKFVFLIDKNKNDKDAVAYNPEIVTENILGFEIFDSGDNPITYERLKTKYPDNIIKKLEDFTGIGKSFNILFQNDKCYVYSPKTYPDEVSIQFTNNVKKMFVIIKRVDDLGKTRFAFNKRYEELGQVVQDEADEYEIKKALARVGNNIIKILNSYFNEQVFIDPIDLIHDMGNSGWSNDQIRELKRNLVISKISAEQVTSGLAKQAHESIQPFIEQKIKVDDYIRALHIFDNINKIFNGFLANTGWEQPGFNDLKTILESADWLLTKIDSVELFELTETAPESIPVLKNMMIKNLNSIKNELIEYFNIKRKSPLAEHKETLKKLIENIINEELTNISENYYHGTVVDLQPGEYLLPPNDTNNISEKGRKKNLDRVFFTKDLGSAKIYAGRAKHSLGGQPKVYLIEPEGQLDTVNAQPGSTVFMAPKAKVVKRIM